MDVYEQSCSEHDMPLSRRYSVVGCEQLSSLLADGSSLLLDCRKLADYRRGHIDGALHVHDGIIASLIDSGDRARRLVIYCYHGHTSEHLAEAFSNAGFVDVFSVKGGYEAWSAAGHPPHAAPSAARCD